MYACDQCTAMFMNERTNERNETIERSVFVIIIITLIIIIMKIVIKIIIISSSSSSSSSNSSSSSSSLAICYEQPCIEPEKRRAIEVPTITTITCLLELCQK